MTYFTFKEAAFLLTLLFFFIVCKIITNFLSSYSLIQDTLMMYIYYSFNEKLVKLYKISLHWSVCHINVKARTHLTFGILHVWSCHEIGHSSVILPIRFTLSCRQGFKKNETSINRNTENSKNKNLWFKYL